jgi:hypothetical protein
MNQPCQDARLYLRKQSFARRARAISLLPCNSCFLIDYSRDKDTGSRLLLGLHKNPEMMAWVNKCAATVASTFQWYLRSGPHTWTHDDRTPVLRFALPNDLFQCWWTTTNGGGSMSSGVGSCSATVYGLYLPNLRLWTHQLLIMLAVSLPFPLRFSFTISSCHQASKTRTALSTFEEAEVTPPSQGH